MTRSLLQKTVDIGPDNPFTAEVTVPEGTQETQLRAALIASDGTELVAYQRVDPKPVDKLPEPVKAPPKPEDISSIEELYLTGLRIEQIHNPRVDPLPYYLEALKRDPGDSRCNVMVGINDNRRGKFEEAEQHLRRAVERLTEDYTRSRDGEAHFQLAVALRGQHRYDEAYDQFYRATWDQAFHASAYFELAAISCLRHDFPQALQHIQNALSTNSLDTRSRDLQVAILRELGRISEARQVAQQVLQSDPLDFWARNELVTLSTMDNNSSSTETTLQQLTKLMRDDVQSYLELASDYMYAGMWGDAIDVLQRPIAAQMQPAGTYPLVHYYLGYLHQQLGDDSAAQACFARGESMPTDYCFPFRLEMVDVLNAALAANPRDARAEYYLGDLLFDLQPEIAMKHWETSRQLDDSLAVVHRNAGWAAYRVKHDIPKAIDCYERALACKEIDPRLLLELDMLYEAGNVDPARRLEALQSHHSVVTQREDSFLREIMVLVLTGKYTRAIDYLENNYFHAQEGRDEIHDVYVDAHLLEGLRLLHARQPQEALQHFRKAAEYPENLSVGRPKNDPRFPEVAYYTGLALTAMGDQDKARQLFAQAADQEETQRWPETRFYQAMSMLKLDRQDDAEKIFDHLIDTAQKQLDQQESADFFAKFGQQTSRARRNAEAHYRIGLGLAGQREYPGGERTIRPGGSAESEPRLGALSVRGFGVEQHLNTVSLLCAKTPWKRLRNNLRKPPLAPLGRGQGEEHRKHRSYS